jgi:hypothetical protein
LRQHKLIRTVENQSLDKQPISAHRSGPQCPGAFRIPPVQRPAIGERYLNLLAISGLPAEDAHDLTLATNRHDTIHRRYITAAVVTLSKFSAETQSLRLQRKIT